MLSDIDRTATRATYATFATSGFAFASWASRIPQVKAQLGLSTSQLGLLLLALAGGSVIALPLSGTIVTRYGSGRTVAAAAALLGVALSTVALGLGSGVAPIILGLFVFGFAYGAWDVAMNVQGAAVERRTGTAIMSRFHAGYSIGTVAGALIGVGMVAWAVPVVIHLLAVALLVGVTVPLAARKFLHDIDQAPARRQGAAPAIPTRAIAAWAEPRTLLIGVVVLAFAFAEGAGNDWIALATITGYGANAATGTFCYGLFLAGMTGGRWVGPAVLERFGRVLTLRVLAGVAVVGLTAFVLGHALPLAFAGCLLWGAGTSLGFPTGMSAAADEPRSAPSRVSVVASIGYCAFLAGPPFIGALSRQVSVLHALLAVVALLVLSLAIVPAMSPPAGAPVVR